MGNTDGPKGSVLSQKIKNPCGLHWFRRDLRLTGNLALEWSLKQTHGRVLGIFFFDSSFLSRPDFSYNRFAFFMQTMLALRTEMRAQGGDLLVLDAAGAVDGFKNLIERLAEKGLPPPVSVSFNRDYEPFARERDAKVEQLLSGTYKIKTHTARDHLLIEPGEILKDGKPGAFYQVYSPFARKWFEKIKTPEVLERIDASLRPLPPFQITWKDLLGKEAEALDQLESYLAKNAPSVNVRIPPAGEARAQALVEKLKNKVAAYGDTRDFLAQAGTSGLSIYFKNGSVTSAQVIAALKLAPEKFETRSGRTTFLKELCWREFYYHILFYRPSVEHEAFLEKYRSIRWENDPAHFEAWKNGMTGYPVVDAAMRQLKQTGWMHNRARMIVASFLTKHLLINWQWGEKYFMELLLDGDLAPNNGGWQWAASTGCDPQPYFRIFNPITQSEKFDLQGDYIRKYVPELAKLSAQEIHFPAPLERPEGYPLPIVDHAEARARALKRYGGGE
jgi:deoxyribodipyrimidine photo-lyase